jgi:ubiquinone/menaquinone biosynthesis C-methylase UbiE
MSNRKTYENRSVVNYYTMVDQLQKPELTILNFLRDDLPAMKMLDVGVGGGRTTLHFGKLAGEYVGIDYSHNMIAACQKRFSDEKHMSFQVADARSLANFADQSFDFVLFSFNGLDSVCQDDRLLALYQIRRVLKRGGVFAFSSHNLNSLRFSRFIEFPDHPVKWPLKILKFCMVVLMNLNLKNVKKKDWGIINDGAHRFRLKTYYIKPTAQIRQLEESGFRDIRQYSLKDGKELSASRLSEINEPWIYYTCRV